jgi:hypothetical protein
MYDEEKEDVVQEKTVLHRRPPGDNWETVDGSKRFNNLTSALDYVFSETGVTDFSIYARKGIVTTKTVVKVEKQVQKYSLYGED